MVRGIYVPADSDESLEVREFTGLDDYQSAVEGWIEPVDVPDLGITIYVNEEGLIRHLPFNSRATFLWWYYVPVARHRAILVGNTVIVGMPDEQGSTADVPAEVETLTKHGIWRVEVKTLGDSKWCHNQVTYEDHFEALAWAMVTLERWTAAEDVRVVLVTPDPIDGASPPDSDQ